VQAVARVLAALRPAGEVKAPEHLPTYFAELGAGFANSMLEEAGSGRSRTMAPQAQQRAASLHRDASPFFDDQLKPYVAFPPEEDQNP
jgi:hypothetical protein